MGHSSRSKGKSCTIHVEHIRLYHEALKFEELIDVETETIYQSVLFVIAKHRKNINMNLVLKKDTFESLLNEIVDRAIIVEKKRLSACQFKSSLQS